MPAGFPAYGSLLAARYALLLLCFVQMYAEPMYLSRNEARAAGRALLTAGRSTALALFGVWAAVCGLVWLTEPDHVMLGAAIFGVVFALPAAVVALVTAARARSVFLGELPIQGTVLGWEVCRLEPKGRSGAFALATQFLTLRIDCGEHGVIEPAISLGLRRGVRGLAVGTEVEVLRHRTELVVRWPGSKWRASHLRSGSLATFGNRRLRRLAGPPGSHDSTDSGLSLAGVEGDEGGLSVPAGESAGLSLEPGDE